LSDSGPSEQDLRVLIVTGTFLPTVGGLEVATHRLAERLIQRGVGVSLVTSRRDPERPAEEVLAGRLRVFRLKQEETPLVGTALHMLRLAAFLWRRRKEYDVVHSCFIDPSTLVSAVLRRLTGRPTICRLSGAAQTGDVRRLEKAFLASLWKWALRAIDRFVVLSEEMAEELSRAGFESAPMCRIPNGVDTDYFRPASVSEKAEARQRLGCADRGPVIAYVGRLSPEKGPADLLRALRPVLQGEPNALVMLVGDGPLAESLREQVQEYGVAENVRFLGNVQDVRTHLWAADLFVLPSRAEGMSNAALEAMACGLPCIATSVSGTPELFGDNEAGIVVPSGQPQRLSEAVLQLWRSPEEASRLGAAAAAKVRSSYSLDAVVERYLELYRECLGERTLPSGR